MLSLQIAVLFIILASVAISILALGSFDICFGLYVKAYCKGKSKEKILALSFDDGPHPEFTQKVLDILNKHKIKAGFFLVGSQIEQNPSLAKQIFSDGHMIGNHSFDHTGKFTIRRTKKIIADLKKNEDLIHEITGKRVQLFRPPFGVTNPNIAYAARFLNYKVVGWSIRSLDTMGKTDKNTIKRVVSRLKPGSIILLHDTHAGIGTILEEVIINAEKQDFTFVRPDELLNIEAYR